MRPPAAPQQLLWAAGGGRLLAVARHRLSLYSVRGRLIAEQTAPAGETLGPAAFLTGDRLAVTLHQRNQPADSVALVDANRQGLRHRPQTLFSAPEQLTGIDGSPNHRWLLTSSPSADQWIFIRLIVPTRFTAVSEIARRFRAGGDAAAGSPVLAGWQP